jgi:Uma2 family endonuclease
MATRVAQFPKPPVGDVHYPDSDGKPMAESDVHIEQIIALRDGLQEYFRDQADVYVSGNIFVYYVEGDPSGVVSPDLLVVKGVEKKLRPSYKVWEEGKGPDVVLEVTSKTTRSEDTFAKFHVYQEVLQVPEYFQFDPTGDYLEPPLQGYRLVGGSYSLMTGLPSRSAGSPQDPDGMALRSKVLGLDLVVEDGCLRLYHPEAGVRLPTYQEAQAARRDVEAALHRETEARARAEAEIARLRAELQSLRGE